MFLLTVCPLAAQNSVIPQVKQAKLAEGINKLNPETTISFDQSNPQMLFNAKYLQAELGRATGYPFAFTPSAAKPNESENVIQLILKKDHFDKQAQGAYKLHITPKKISIYAKDAQGVFYGIQTLRQLLPAEIHSQEVVAGKGWTVPAGTIDDEPRFQWRGFMLDSCRHMQSLDVIKKLIDRMAQYKLNVFHWHLTEDEAWRMEIKKYPKLTSIGANPGTGAEGEELNGFYTQEQMKEIVRYANERYIKVVPEFDIPGHVNALVASYPEYGCGGKPLEIGKRDMRAFSSKAGRRALCAGNEKTIPFVMDIFEEMAAIFGDNVFHIGGDERPKGIWEKCAECQAQKNKLQLKSEHHLQNWFLNEVSERLRKKGIRTIAWAEHIKGGIPKNQITQAWRGNEAVDGAKAGHQVVNSINPYLYLDYPANAAELGKHAEWMRGQRVPASKIFHYDIVPRNLTPEQQKLIIGVEAPLWTETVKMDRLDNKIFPRLITLAETAWVKHSEKDWKSFQRRFAWHQKSMQLQGITYDATDKISE